MCQGPFKVNFKFDPIQACRIPWNDRYFDIRCFGARLQTRSYQTRCFEIKLNYETDRVYKFIYYALSHSVNVVIDPKS